MTIRYLVLFDWSSLTSTVWLSADEPRSVDHSFDEQSVVRPAVGWSCIWKFENPFKSRGALRVQRKRRSDDEVFQTPLQKCFD
jgi:hypothetical protein